MEASLMGATEPRPVAAIEGLDPCAGAFLPALSADDVVPAPGSWGGPCNDGPCGHGACAAAHELADTECGLCGERIGFGRRHLECREHGVVHRDCWADTYETPPVAYATTAADQAADRIEARS